jgi:hypothetical protein
MATDKIQINRAPVMALWASIVAGRLGFDQAEALTLGKVVTGLNAQSKGQRLGIYDPDEAKKDPARKRQPDEQYFTVLLGRRVPVVETEHGCAP